MEPKTFMDAVKIFTDLGLNLIPLLGVIAFLVFILGTGKFIRSTSNDAEREKKKQILIWGIIGLFALFTVWGIVSFVRGEFGFGTGVVIPLIKTGGTIEDVNSTITFPSVDSQ